MEAGCTLEESGDLPYDIVRGAFPKGQPIYDSCVIHDQTHIQVCVRNSKAIRNRYHVPANPKGFYFL